MNIGIFTDCYYPIINGVITSIRLLEEELRSKGHNVYIFTTTNPSVDKEVPNVFRITSIPFVLCKPQRMAMIYSVKVAKKIKELDLDIIHLHTEFSIGIFGLRMARKLHIPVVHTYHTMYKDYTHYISKGKVWNDLTTDMIKVISRKFCEKCDAIITPSQKTYDLLKNEYMIKNDCYVIPTGINTSKFENNKYNKSEIIDIKKKFKINNNDKIMLFVGRLAKEKSIDDIINEMIGIVKVIPNLKFLIVGNGPYKNELEYLIDSLGLRRNVILAGEFKWDDISKIYNFADVYISASRTETQGLTLIEAMASRIPVIARKDRNLEGLIMDEYNGIVFNENYEIKNKVISTIMDEKKIAYLVKNAERTINKFSAEEYGNRVEKLYYNMIHERSFNRQIVV